MKTSRVVLFDYPAEVEGGLGEVYKCCEGVVNMAKDRGYVKDRVKESPQELKGSAEKAVDGPGGLDESAAPSSSKKMDKEEPKVHLLKAPSKDDLGSAEKALDGAGGLDESAAPSSSKKMDKKGQEVHLLKAPPKDDLPKFFRRFPAHFYMVRPEPHLEYVLFEFWKGPLKNLPGLAGFKVVTRVRAALRRMRCRAGDAEASFRVVLLVANYTEAQLKKEMALVEEVDCKVEVFAHRFFHRFRHNRTQHRPPMGFVTREEAVEHFGDTFGTVANLPKLSASNWWARYLRAGPGDILRVDYRENQGTCRWYLVVPGRRFQPTVTEDWVDRVEEEMRGRKRNAEVVRHSKQDVEEMFAAILKKRKVADD